MTSVTLTILNTGYCYHPEAVVIQGGAWRVKRFPATFALIQHPEWGTLLFDTGYSERFFSATQSFPQRLYRWVTPVHTQASESASAQLRQRGIAPESVRAIVISHVHGDHIGGLRDFPNAQFIGSRQVAEDLLPLGDWASTRQGFLKALLPDDFLSRCRFLEDTGETALPDTLQPFEHGVDLLDDGSVMAVALPGHHPGHYGLFCRTGEGDVFLVGDACWHRNAYEQQRPPHPVSHLIMDDIPAYHETLRRLSELHRRNPALRIIPSHCPDWHAHFLGGTP